MIHQIHIWTPRGQSPSCHDVESVDWSAMCPHNGTYQVNVPVGGRREGGGGRGREGEVAAPGEWE